MLASNAKKRQYSLSEYNFLLNFPENGNAKELNWNTERK